MTLRARLIAALLALVAVALLAFGVATYQALDDFLTNRVDTQLRDARGPTLRAMAQTQEPSFDTASQLPPGTYGELRDVDGSLISRVSFVYGDQPAPRPDLPAVLDASEQQPFTTGAQDGDYRFRVLVTDLSGGRQLVVAIPLDDLESTLQRLLRIELVVAALVLAALGVAGWYVVRLGLRPLDHMASTAGAIAAGDLSRRVEPADDRTEVGRLGASLNTMLARIQVAFEERQASEQRLRRFLADVSHELRTPLTSIRGYAELFRRGADRRPEDLATAMRRIEDEAARMGVLVDDLLLLARLDESRQPLRERVDLAQLLEDACGDARVTDPSRPLTVRTTGAVPVTGDEVRLRQLVGNLVNNALVHTPAGTPVEARATVEAGNAVVEVVDRGPGLDPDAVDRVFDRFWRADESRSRDHGGAGLGLAIVAAVARAHGGVAQARNREGGGASFVVRLPLASAEIRVPGETDGQSEDASP